MTERLDVMDPGHTSRRMPVLSKGQSKKKAKSREGARICDSHVEKEVPVDGEVKRDANVRAKTL